MLMTYLAAAQLMLGDAYNLAAGNNFREKDREVVIHSVLAVNFLITMVGVRGVLGPNQSQFGFIIDLSQFIFLTYTRPHSWMEYLQHQTRTRQEETKSTPFILFHWALKL